MSRADTSLGISELEIERVHRHDFIEVWTKPTKKPLCKHCESRHLRVKATHKCTVKRTRHGNQVLTLHLKVPKYHFRCCGRYFRHPFVGIRPRYRASECFRLEVFEAHHGGVTQRGISRTHRIREDLGILATTDSGNMAHYTQQRHHRRLPQQNGDDFEKSVWF